jgi:hypothetical protein
MQFLYESPYNLGDYWYYCIKYTNLNHKERKGGLKDTKNKAQTVDTRKSRIIYV